MPETQPGDPQDYLSSLYTPPAEIKAGEKEVMDKSQGVTDDLMKSVRAANQQQVEMIRNLPKGPADPKLQNVPKAPQPHYNDPLQAFQNPAVLIASLGSLFTRAPLTTALKSGAAAMEAFHKGEQEKFEQERQNWKEATEEAIQQNRVELDRYNAKWEKTNLSVKEKLAEIAALAAGSKDEVMLGMLRKGDLKDMLGLWEKRQAANDKLVETITRSELQEKIRIATMSPDKVALNKFVQENPKATAQELAAFLKSTKGGTPMAEDSLETMADQYLAGDKSVFQNIGRGAQGSENISKLREVISRKMKEQNISGAQQATKMAEFSGLTAGERTLGTRTANIEMAVNEAYNMLPIAKEASERVPRTKWLAVNKAVQAGLTQSGDPDIATFLAAHNAVINTYARAISPSGVPTVADKEHAREIFSTATGPEAYNAVLNQIAKEMEAARKSPGQVREEFRRGHVGGALPTEAPNDGWKIERVQP